MTQVGTVIEGKYEILKEIGRGGMSVVYLANDTHLNRNWAVKEVRKKGNGKNDEIVVNSLVAPRSSPAVGSEHWHGTNRTAYRNSHTWL